MVVMPLGVGDAQTTSGVDPHVQGESDASRPLDAPARVLGAMGSSPVSSHPSAAGVQPGVTQKPRPRSIGVLASLPQLHTWISEHWEPLITGEVHIFPMAKEFFVAKFDNAQGRDKILCDHFFSWEDKFLLMIKPWHFYFNPSTKMFNKIPTWVRLPNPPLHLWNDSLLEEVGDALGDFLMMDAESSDIFHSIFVRILVDLDISNGPPAEILLYSSKGSWVQSLDYEGIPFRYKRCFKLGMLLSIMSLRKWQLRLHGGKETQEASLGDNDLASTLVFTKSTDLPADVGVLSSTGFGEVVSVGQWKFGDIGVFPLLSVGSGEAETTATGVFPLLSVGSGEAETTAAGSHSQDFGVLDWHVKATQVEEG
ncbi:hypothetical protein SUGI_0317610 [Cryptomeria japonica]|nr:hypothetical protein SUGI_0317610 [Cryptomeria japonica]